MGMKQTEALKLALEALGWYDRERHQKAITAIREALAEQPTQQQESVASLLVGQDSDGRYVAIAAKAHADTLPLGEHKLYTSPTTVQPQQQSKPLSILTEDNIPAFPWVSQKPVAWMHTNAIGHVYFRKNPQDKTLNPVPLYTSPPASKPWVGLTDEEMKAIHRNAGVSYLVPADYDRHLFTHLTDVQLMKISSAIEAKLKEKNHG